MKTILASLFAFLAFDATAASFDCAKATSKVEKMICADPALSKLDEQLAATYRKVATDWDTVYNDQREWLRVTRDRCTTSECLASAYRARIEVLEHWHDPQPWSDGLHGTYLEPRRFMVVGEKDWEKAGGEDCLSIYREKDGTVRVAISSVQTNAHSCELDLEVRREGERIRTVPEEDSECRLTVRAERGALVVEDPEATCREYCGARAHLDGLTFRRSTRKEAACPGAAD